MKKFILCFLLALCQYAPSKAQQVDTLEAPHESGLITGKIVKGLHERNIATRILYKEEKVMPSAVPSDDCITTSVWSTPQSVIKLAVLGDGYTQAQLTSHVQHVQDLSGKFFLPYPLSLYKNYFEMIAVSCPSAESGIDHPNTASDCFTASPAMPTATVNTRYNGTADYGGTHRLFYCTNTSQINTDATAKVPGFNKILVLLNTPHYGGSGGNYSIGSMHPSADKIMIHEFMHSFVGLADEYGGSYCNGLEKPNVTKVLPPKWGSDAGVPIPTPANTNCGKKGAYNGANYCTNGWYRPECDCGMRTLLTPFRLCVVCQDATTAKIKTLIPTNPDPQPVKPIVLINGSNNYTVSIQSGSNATLNASGATTYQWSNGQTNAAIIVAPSSTTSYSVVGTKDGLKDTAFATVQVTPVNTDCVDFTWTVSAPYINNGRTVYDVKWRLTSKNGCAKYKMERGTTVTYPTPTPNYGIGGKSQGLTAGTYVYKLTCVATGCSETFSVTVP